MTIDVRRYSDLLESVASELDISPEKYQEAVNRYQTIGRWLQEGAYPASTHEPDIYVQGSFRLGTIVRPIRNGVEASYDIDLVCELQITKERTSPQAVKSMVGNRLREHGTYRRLLQPEGRRCWTLQYAEQDGVGFHIDVLPAVPDGRGLPDTAIAITNKNGSAYSWSPSDPRGYGEWFDSKNAFAFARVAIEEKRRLQRRAALIFESIDKVPDLLVRTPLQRSIQLMKRHRDLRFNHPDRVEYAPISIIITTLAAHLYGGEADVYSALSAILRKLQAHTGLLEGKSIDPALATMGLIRRRPDGTWYIGNPVRPEENFADRWHENNHARARAFFSWVTQLQEDLLDVVNNPDPGFVKEHLGRTLGSAVVTRAFESLIPVGSVNDGPPRIHIVNAPKPWKER